MNGVNLSREAAPIGDCLLWACLEFGLGLNSTTRMGLLSSGRLVRECWYINFNILRRHVK